MSTSFMIYEGVRATPTILSTSDQIYKVVIENIALEILFIFERASIFVFYHLNYNLMKYIKKGAMIRMENLYGRLWQFGLRGL